MKIQFVSGVFMYDENILWPCSLFLLLLCVVKWSTEMMYH